MNIEELYDLFIDSNGISTDTRTLRSGELYFALKGERFDGNTLAKEAIEKGALRAIVDDSDYAQGENIILVKDSLAIMQELAKYHRNLFKNPVIGITGSNGKTTTKELIVQVLSTNYKVHATKGNFNNHIGVPLTILSASLESDIWIIEMGTNAPGEIGFLCSISKPNFGLITNIGAAHLEKLINLEGVFIEKTALFESVMRSHGLVFLNLEDPYLRRYSDKLDKQIGYNASGSDGFSLIPLEIDKNPFLNLEIVKDNNGSPLLTHLIGRYNQINLSAALCVALHFNIECGEAISALADYVPNNMRSQLVRTSRNHVVLDGYNANPTSMVKAIESFLEQGGEDKVLFIGDMLELGEASVSYHEKIVQLIESTGLEFYLIGSEFQKVRPYSSVVYHSVQLLLESINLNNIANKKILLKGSRGVRLEMLMEHL